MKSRVGCLPRIKKLRKMWEWSFIGSHSWTYNFEPALQCPKRRLATHFPKYKKNPQSEVPQSIINHIPTKRRTSAKHRRVPEFHRHVLHPFVMLLLTSAHFTRKFQMQNRVQLSSSRHLQGKKEIAPRYPAPTWHFQKKAISNSR